MASACVNNMIEPYTWPIPPASPGPDLSPDFEFFRLEDPSLTPADELFSDGKLVPLKPISTARSATSEDPKPVAETPRSIRVSGLSDPDPYAFSPRAPTCSIRWKNILRLKKLTKPTNNQQPKPSPARSLTRILNRVGSKPESDTDSVSTSSRLSLSSSSSSHDHDDVIPKPTPRTRVTQAGHEREREREKERTCSVLADSPRLNSSGKVVFERSSSSPGSFTGGPRYKHSGGIERSYSAHVRVAPVLNVPVKFGFPLFSASHKRENVGINSNRVQRRNSRNGSRTTDQA